MQAQTLPIPPQTSLSDADTPRGPGSTKITHVDSLHVTRARLAKKVDVSSKTTEKISEIVHTDLELQAMHFLISAGLYGPLKKMESRAWLEKSLFDIIVGTPLWGP